MPEVKRLLIMLLVSQVFGNVLFKTVAEGKIKWKPNIQVSHLHMQYFKVSQRLGEIKKASKKWWIWVYNGC